MGNNDIEMEDAQKHEHDSGINIEESEEGKVLDARIQNEGEEFPSAVTVSGTAMKSENGGDEINKLSNEAKEQAVHKSKMENQTNHETESDKPVYVVRFTGEQINNKSESEERSSAINNSKELTAARSTADELFDHKNELFEQIAADGGLKEENSTDNDMELGNPVQNVVEENPSGHVAVENPKGTEKEVVDFVNHVASKEMSNENADGESDFNENRKSVTELSSNEAPEVPNVMLDEVPQSAAKDIEDTFNVNEDKSVSDEPKKQCVESVLANPVTDGDTKTGEAAVKHESDDSCLPNQHEAVTPKSLVIYSSANVGDHSGDTAKAVFTQSSLPPMGESDDGTLEDQAAFMREIESFYRGRAMDFKPPKFYGQPLNCLKLWRAVIRLGGYDRVTGSKLWRQVGESFHPPKTCTTVSWTFRIFYEKSLLEYERYKRQIGELQLPVLTLPEASGPDSEGNGYQGSGSGRARRDAAARAMQGWHVQRLFGNGEVGEPVVKDKNINNMAKRDKNMKSIGSLKQKRPNEVENSVKAARTETSKQLVTSVVDIGPPADWVKINVRQTKDCFEVYALVPGLLREEVRVQSDPAGRLVITGQPEQVDNPWGITPFKKVVSLPLRIDPLQTSAVVSLHGRLFVRVPFELSNA
ncbi:hypothetical protein ACS0TY_013699 [Phlomoides rotata]